MQHAISDTLPDVATRPAQCEQHGAFEQRAIVPAGDGMTAIWSECPECATVRTERAREQVTARELEQRREAISKRFTDTATPPRFAGCTFANFLVESDDQRAALRASQLFAERFPTVLERGGSLTLTGPTGTGKTHLAAAALRAVTAAGFTGLYRLADAAVRYLKASYTPGNPYTEDQALAHLRLPDLLVLDEIGNQHDSADEKRVLFAILNARYAHMRPTLLVSNLTGDQLKQWAGQAFHDRLLEGGYVVPCQWPSYRPRVGRKGGA